MSNSVWPHRLQPPGSPVPGILQARILEWVAISFSNAWKWKVKVKSLSRVRLLATPWTAAYQAPPSMGFSRQSTGVGSHCLLRPQCTVLLKKKRHRVFLGKTWRKNKKCLVYTAILPQEDLASFYSRDSGSVSWLKPGNWLILFLWFMLVLCSLDLELFGFYKLSVNLVALLSTFRNTVIS